MIEDVRVKLSAEGVAEVIAALRSVGNEGQNAAHSSNAAFSELGDELKGIGKSLVGFLAIGALFESLKTTFEGLFDKAGEIDDFAKATGLSTDAVQGLMAAATKAHVPLDVLEDSINRLTIQVGRAGQGVKGALSPFDALGIKFADFRKLSPAEQFQLIAEKLEQIHDPATRAALGTQLFGKQFQQLQPLIEQVAEHGIQSFVDQLAKLGILLDGQTILAMKHVDAQMTTLKAEATGLATQFLSGLLPSIEQAMAGILQATNQDGVSGFRAFGEFVGNVGKGIVAEFLVVGKTIALVIASIVTAVDHAGDIVKSYAVSNLNFLKNLTIGGALAPDLKAPDLTKYKAAQKGVWEGYLADVKKIWDDYNKPPPPPPPDPDKDKSGSGHGPDPAAVLAQAKALAQSRYQLLSAQLDNELALYQAHAQLLGAQEQQQYNAGKISLQTYFADRAKIINDQADKEVATLKQKRAVLASIPVSANDPTEGLQRQAQLAQIDGQIQIKQAQRAQALAENTVSQRQAQRQLYDDQLTAEAKLANLQGKRFEASRDQLKLQLEQLDQILRKAGEAQSVREAALATAKAQGEALIQFNEQQLSGNTALQTLNTDIAGIQDQVAHGLIFQVDADQQIIDLEKQRLPALQKIAQAQLAAAEASKDPQAIASAQAFIQKLGEIAVATDVAGRRMADYKAAVSDALQNGIVDFLQQGIQNVHSFKDAFRELVVDVLKGLARIAAQKAALGIVQALFGGSNTTSAGSNDVAIGSDSVTLSAAGNVFQSGHVVRAFAKGGAFTNSIAMQPTLAPMALFGEGGKPEAIMPLTRDSQGNLGVKSSGGGGGDVNINTQVNVDGNGGGGANKSGSSATLLRQFGDLMTQKARETVTREMQPGGLLWRWRNGS